MDSIMNMAKQGFEKYQESQGGGQQQNQGQQRPPRDNDYDDEGRGQGRQGGYGGERRDDDEGYDERRQGGGQGRQGEYDGGERRQEDGYGRTGGEEYNQRPSAGANYPDVDEDHAVRTADEHAGGTGSSDLFSQGLKFFKQHSGTHTIDESHVQDAHRQAYESGNAGGLDASSLGSAAALQTLLKFTQGGAGGSSSGGGGGMQSKLIGMAMSEAAKLFESQGASGGNKQDAVNGAAATVGKLLLQSKFNSMVGGGNSGGLGQLAGLAGKFM